MCGEQGRHELGADRIGVRAMPLERKIHLAHQLARSSRKTQSMQAVATHISFSLGLSVKLARVRIVSYLHTVGASLLELKLSAFCLAGVFVQGAVDLRGPSHMLARAFDGGHVQRALTFSTIFTLGAAWTLTQWTWIMQPREENYSRSLPISRATVLSAIMVTLIFTDSLLLAFVADGSWLAISASSSIGVAILHVSQGLALILSLVALQWCVLMRARVAACFLGAVATLCVDWPRAAPAWNALWMCALLGMQGVCAWQATQQKVRPDLASSSAALSALALRRPLVTLQARVLAASLRRGVGVRLGLLVVVQTLAICIVHAKPAAEDSSIALVPMYLLTLMLATKLVDFLVQARQQIEPYLRSLPRSSRYWQAQEGMVVSLIALLFALPVLCFALATARINEAAALRLFVLSLPPLALFAFLRTAAVRARGGYLVLVWFFSAWLILA
jgi:hypothetical protein